MSFLRLYGRVLEKLGSDSRLGWFLAFANVALAVAQFAEPVLFGRVINLLAGAQANPAVGRLVGPVAAADRLGRLRPFHHPSRHAGRALCRPAGAPPPPGGADRLFRARAAIAARLSRRRPFRPADEDHAAGHRRAVGVLARFFPRASGGLRVAAHSCAAGAFHQLAAGDPADSCCACCSPCSRRWSCARPKRCRAPCRRIIPIWPSAHRTRSATSRWCKVSRASRPR